MTRSDRVDRRSVRVWMLCWRYPVHSETIVATEFAEMLAQGVDGVLVPLLPDDGRGEVFDVPEERIVRPSPWPVSRPAQIGLLLQAFRRRPLGFFRMLRRAWDFRGDDARGALSSTLTILESQRDVPPDHIHAHFAGHLAHVAALLAAYCRCPWSASAHAKDIYMKPERLAADFRDAAFVRTISSHGQAWILEHCPGFTRKRTPLVYCGVDTDRLRPAPKASLAHRPFRVVSVGRLVPKKGHDILVDACARLLRNAHRIECTIVGNGPERDRLNALIKNAGIESSVRVAEGLSRHELLDTVRQSDAMVLACHVAEDGDRDGIPLALMEAMALGTPVVAADVGGVGELVSRGGVLLSAPEPGTLAAALEELMQTGESARQELGRKGRLRVEADFCLAKNVTALLSQVRSEG